MRGESGKGDEEETVEDKELVTSLLNEWSAGGTNALSLNIEESDAQRYTRSSLICAESTTYSQEV